MLQAVCQGFSFDQFPHQKLPAIRFLQIEDSSNIRMIEGSKNLGLALKTGDTVRITRNIFLPGKETEDDYDGLKK
jgi:hypothetical protein